MQIKLLVEGGEMKPGPVLSQKLGPVGIPMNVVIQKINDATKDFKGMKVPVELAINPDTHNFEVLVSSPPTSELLKKELGIEKGSAEHKKTQMANASIENIIAVTKTKMPSLLSKDLKSAVKTVVGSCVSLGVLIENKSPQEIEKEIDAGKYDSEISQEKTETSDEKRKELDDYFTQVKSTQEKIKQQEEAAKVAEEAAKAEKPAESTPVAEEKKEETPKKK
ncbi:MAG: 50S ribosomal protein L11 [Nanoarchaeota archaeon]|nr:50S ribosomal protein L11 [Nanoarchaeota archaeon]